MFGTHFYHQKVRKCVSIFGALFNNIYVVRQNGQIKVPLSYAPKQKYLERIRENPDLSENSQVAIKLPRMSFEITSFSYDNTRQLTKVSNFTAIGTANTNRQKFFSPVPYNINFQLNVYAKNQDDALQIVEQILPTFNPQYTLTIKPFVSEYPDFKEDIPIAIQSLSFSDDFEGALEHRAQGELRDLPPLSRSANEQTHLATSGDSRRRTGGSGVAEHRRTRADARLPRPPAPGVPRGGR